MRIVLTNVTCAEGGSCFLFDAGALEYERARIGPVLDVMGADSVLKPFVLLDGLVVRGVRVASTVETDIALSFALEDGRRLQRPTPVRFRATPRGAYYDIESRASISDRRLVVVSSAALPRGALRLVLEVEPLSLGSVDPALELAMELESDVTAGCALLDGLAVAVPLVAPLGSWVADAYVDGARVAVADSTVVITATGSAVPALVVFLKPAHVAVPVALELGTFPSAVSVSLTKPLAVVGTPTTVVVAGVQAASGALIELRSPGLTFRRLSGISGLSALSGLTGLTVLASFEVTPSAVAEYNGTVTVSLGRQDVVPCTRAYAVAIFREGEVVPRVTALLALNGALSGADYNVLGFAAGRTYSGAASPPSTITLTFTGIDPSPTSTTEVAATGAVRVYVGGTLVAGSVSAYTYDSSTHMVTVTSMTLGATTGSLEFGVTVTAPSGATMELRSSGHVVYAVPDTVSVATIAGGDTYKLVATKATDTQFAFSNSNSTIDASLGAFASGSTSALLTLATTATVSLGTALSASKALGAAVTATAVDTAFTYTFVSTRTTAAVTVASADIYTFPSAPMCSVVSSGSSLGSIVTLTKASTLTVTFGAALPKGASHTISSTGATYALATASPFASRTTAPQYTLTPTAKQDIVPTITVTLGSVVVTYSPTALASNSIYTFPTGLSSVVEFTGPTAVAADQTLGTLAVGAAYGTAAGTAVCGTGNTSSIVITLSGFDTATTNNTEIKTAALSCVDSGTSTAYGTMGTYTYTAASHSVSIDAYTLGASPPASGSLQFKAIVTAPDGYTSSLTTTAIPAAVDATTGALTAFATGLTLVSGSSVTVPVTFGPVTPASADFSSTGNFSSLATSVSSNSFAATYSGAAASTTFTFIVAPTRRRLTATVAAAGILVWPTIVSTGPTGTVTMGAASAIATTLSASVPSVVTAALSALTAANSSTGATLGTPTVSGTAVSYTLTPASNTTYTATLTLSAGSYSKAYTAQTLATADQVYAWPTGVTALLALNGALSGADYNVLGFAAGRTYSGAASPTSTITLTFTGIDPSPTNATEVAATGAVRVYVGGTLVAGSVGGYTYDSSTHMVTVTSMTLGTATGALEFGVTVTAPSGATMELRSSGHVVYAVPDTVSVATIAGGDTYKLVATKATDTQFAFSNSNSTIDASLGAFASGSASEVLTLATTATVSLAATLSASRALGAAVTATAVDTAFTYTFVSTRTTAAVTVASADIYTFPSAPTCSVVSSGSSLGSIVTLNKASTLTVTFGAALPKGATHVVSSTGATYALVTTSPLTARNATPQYTMTPMAKQDIDPTITVTFGHVAVTYGPTALASTEVYMFPTGLASIITIGGAGAQGQDASIAALASSALYGTGSTLCGTGNTSSIVLALTGYDATTANTTEVKTSAVSASAGTIGSYTYEISSHSVSLGTYTSPVSGSVAFSVVVTAPDGHTKTLTTSGISVIETPAGCTATTIASSTYAVVDGSAVSVPYTLSGTEALAGFAAGSQVSSVIDAITGSGLTFGTTGNFTALGAFALSTTYAGSTGSATATLIMAQTRARLNFAMQGYKFPTTVSFSQPALAVGAATSITATTDTAIATSTAYSVSASSGTVVASGSGTAASDTAQVAFTFAPAATTATGTLQMTFASITKSLSAELPAPLIVTQTSLEWASMSVGTALEAQTLTLSGAGTSALVAANIAVYLNTSSTQVSNCTVGGYAPGTGVVTFTPTPSVSGMNTLYVRVALYDMTWIDAMSGTGFFVSEAYPTSFTFTVPTTQTSVAITRTTGTTDPIPTDVYYGTEVGITTIAGLTKFGSDDWGKTTTTTFSSEGGIPFPYDTTLYLYVRCQPTSGAVLGNAAPFLINSGYYPTSFTFTVPTTQTSVAITRTTGTTSIGVAVVYYGTEVGIASIAGLVQFGMASWTISKTTTFSSTYGTPFPYDTTLYLYVGIGSASSVVLGNAAPIWISSVYLQPTSFTFTVQTPQTLVSIKRTTGTTTAIPTEVYYGTEVGITSIAGLTKFGSGDWGKTTTTAFFSTDGTPFPLATTLYLYVRCPATSGALLGNATSFTPMTDSAYYPTSFTFTPPTSQTIVSIKRTTGTTASIPTEVYYGTDVGITSIAGLVKFGSGWWFNTITSLVYSTYGTPFPYDTTLYLYVSYGSASSVVLGSAAPIWISSVYVQPDWFTFTAPTTQTSVGITRTTGTATAIPTEVYYGTEVGITSIAGLTKFGSGDWGRTTTAAFSSTDGTPFPLATTLYLYVRCPATSGALLGNATSFLL